MKRAYDMVREFHVAFDVPVREEPVFHSEVTSELQLRWNLILEEVRETCKALEESNRVELADGLADVYYVVAGSDVQLKLNCNDDIVAVASIAMLQELLEKLHTVLLVDPDYYDLSVILCRIEITLRGIASCFQIDIDAVLDAVHGANMAKLDPETGKPNYRESDRKVLKPAGWKPADIAAIVGTDWIVAL